MIRKIMAILATLVLFGTSSALAGVPAFEDIQFPENPSTGIFLADGTIDYSYDDMSQHYSLEIITDHYGVPTLPSDEDPIAAYLSKALNIDLTLTTVASSDLATTLAARFAADDAPDIITLNTSDRDMAFTLSDAGLLIDAKTLYPYMPMHQKYATASMLQWSTNVNGELPFVTKYGLFDGVWCLAMRADWLQTLGMEVPKTKEELLAYAVAVTTQDPDGNGINDTYFMTGASGGASFGMLQSAFSTMAGNADATVDENGVLSHPYFNGVRKEFLSFMKELYDLNVLAPDWYTIDWETAKSYTLNDKIGMVYYPAANLYSEYAQAQGNFEKETIDAWQFIDYPIDGGKYVAAGNPGLLIGFSTKNFEGQEGKLLRALHLMDTLAIGGENFTHTSQMGDDVVFEDFGLDLVSHQEFVYTDDGMFYIHQSGQDENGAMQFPYNEGAYGGLLLAPWQNFGLNVSWQLTDPEQATDEMSYFAQACNTGKSIIAGIDRWPNVGLAVALTGDAAEAASTLKDFINSAEYEFVTGIRSLDEYDTFAQEWLGKGGKAIIQQTAECMGAAVPDYAK